MSSVKSAQRVNCHGPAPDRHLHSCSDGFQPTFDSKKNDVPPLLSAALKGKALLAQKPGSQPNAESSAQPAHEKLSAPVPTAACWLRSCRSRTSLRMLVHFLHRQGIDFPAKAILSQVR